MKDPRIGRERFFKNEYTEKGIENVVAWDVLPVKKDEVVKVVFESVNSTLRQGIWLRTDKGVVINDYLCPSADLWYDTSPKEVICVCHTKDGFLSVYNIFENERKKRMSQATRAGMLVEELLNGRRYRCNDISFGIQMTADIMMKGC
jgi:hypothetical protein